MELIKINNVTKTFDEGKNSEKVILKNVNLTINDGEFVSLLGPSGCGKTTLLSMIGGFTTPTSGEILLDGVKVLKPSSERGYVFQNYALFPWMTVKKNVEYALKFSKISTEEKNKRLDYLLDMSHLKGHESKYPIQLSGGMQQRVAVARALAGSPRVLLLDEPLGAIDFQMRELMQNELDEMVQTAHITAVMVTHDVSESVFMSDRVIVIGSYQGHIVADMKIDLPRKRDRSSKQFEEYVYKLTNLVRDAFNERKHTIEEDNIELKEI